MDRVTKRLDQLGENVKHALEAVGVGIGLKDVIDQFDEFVNHAAELENTSRSIGIAVDELSRLQFAAGQTGVATDQLTTGIERFAKTAAQAASVASSQQAAAFEAIGVAVKDTSGNLKPMSDLLSEVADKFAGYSDSAEKTALAQILFGRSGADLIPLLDKGSAGIAELGQRSDELGNTINDKTSKAADAFNAKLGELHAETNGFWNLLAQGLLPTLTEIVNSFVTAGAGATKFEVAIETLTTGLKLLVDAGTSISTTFKDIGNYLGAATAANVAVLHGHLSEAVDIWKSFFQDVEKTHSDANTFLDKLWNDEIDSSAAWKASLVDDWNKVANAAKTQAPVVQTAIDDTATAYDNLTAQVEKALIAQGVAIDNKVEAQLQSLPSKAVHYGTTMWDQLDTISQQGASAIQGDFDNFLVNPAKVGFKGLVISFAQTLDQMLAKAAATDLFNALFDTDKSGSSGLGGILGGFLGSIFTPSASAARGANLNDYGGAYFATGGSFTVGGSGGTDSQLVSFHATPGEKVSVTRPGQSNGGGDVFNINVSATVGDVASRSDVVAGMQQAMSGAVAKIQDMKRRGSFK